MNKNAHRFLAKQKLMLWEMERLNAFMVTLRNCEMFHEKHATLMAIYFQYERLNRISRTAYKIFGLNGRVDKRRYRRFVLRGRKFTLLKVNEKSEARAT